MNANHTAACELKPWTVEHRRHIHRNPELSLTEEQTAAYCQKVLRDLGYDVKPSWGFGFTADLAVTGAKHRVALRADMDALPIQEQNKHAFVSTRAGVAHMCGHDTHMAIAMTAAKLIAERRDALKSSVRFLFQPSEETPPGGAIGMIAYGCLADCDEVYGLHNDPGTPVGKVRLRAGAMTATADRFSLTIKGKGCHAARPQDGLDPVPAAAGVVLEWQTLVSRRLDPVHPAVVSVTQIHAGTTFNIIPDEAVIGGTVRTFFGADRDMIEKLMRASLVGLEARGYRCEFTYLRGYDSIVNHESGVRRVADAAGAVLGAENVDPATDPVAWGEDFSYYLQHKPGAFFFLGSGNAKLGVTEPLHSPRFDVDEDCMPIGAAIMTELVLRA
jgi:amidohydrolase